MSSLSEGRFTQPYANAIIMVVPFVVPKYILMNKYSLLEAKRFPKTPNDQKRDLEEQWI